MASYYDRSTLMGVRSDNKRLLRLAAAAGDIFAARLQSAEAMQIMAAATQAGMDQAETLTKFWQSQYNRVMTELIEFALSRRSGSQWLAIVHQHDERLMKNGFLGAVERVFSRAIADATWAAITRPRTSGKLLKKSDGQLHNHQLLSTSTVQVAAYENLFVVLLDSEPSVFGAEWNVMETFFESVSFPAKLNVPVGKAGTLEVDSDWADVFLAQGMTAMSMP